MVDLLIQHYDKLERLLAKTDERQVDVPAAAERGTSLSVDRRASGETTVPTILAP